MTRVLDAVNSPADLKGLTSSELSKLAEEIREEIISTVSNCGDIWRPTWVWWN